MASCESAALTRTSCMSVCSSKARDVLGDGALEEAVVLGDEGDLAAQGSRVPAGKRLAVDKHRALTWRIAFGAECGELGGGHGGSLVRR
jgi:hypothetical protein